MPRGLGTPNHRNPMLGTESQGWTTGSWRVSKVDEPKSWPRFRAHLPVLSSCSLGLPFLPAWLALQRLQVFFEVVPSIPSYFQQEVGKSHLFMQKHCPSFKVILGILQTKDITEAAFCPDASDPHLPKCPKAPQRGCSKPGRQSLTEGSTSQWSTASKGLGFFTKKFSHALHILT